MADLDFKHHVSEIPKGQELPGSVGRKVAPIVGHTPDFLGALTSYGEATNWMSSLGSYVATTASNEIAMKFGTELGKNPKGDIGIPLTDFDKVMQQSYASQAEITLGLQAQKMISQSNLELAKQPRISSSMIAETQQSNLKGLENIYSLAPSSVRPNLEKHMGSVMIQQNEHLVNRMLGDQKTDRIQAFELSAKTNAENAFALGMSGNDVGAQAAMNATISASRASAARKDISPLEARVKEDAIRQSYLSGRETKKAIEAEKNGKLPEHLNSLANNPDIPINDRQAVIRNVLNYMNMQAALRSQNEQLRMAEFNSKLAENPLEASSQFASLTSELDPIQTQKMKLKLAQALNKYEETAGQYNELINGWGDSRLQARTTPKIQNKAFDILVNKRIKDSGGNITQDQAEVEVAALAGGPVAVFTDTLKTQLKSGNPIQMESAAQKIHALYQMGEGHALEGLSAKDNIMFETIQALRNSLEPTEAMREAVNAIYNQKSELIKSNKDKWNNHLSTELKLSKTKNEPDYAIKKFGYHPDDFLNPSVAQLYGTDMLEKYSINYQLSNGDDNVAKAVTQRYIDENYGETGINGGSHATLHPLEKVLGYDNKNVVPIIQENIKTTLDSRFADLKIAFDMGETNEYWETLPIEDIKRGREFFHKNKTMQVKRYTQTDKGLKSETFDLIVQGNAFDTWDLSVYSKTSGLKPLYQAAPYLGAVTFAPNKAWIDAEFLKRHT